jgi:integrase
MNDGAETGLLEQDSAPQEAPAAERKMREKVRGDGSLWLPKGSAVYWGTYYSSGKPQRFSTGERDRRKAASALRRRVAAVTVGQAVPEDSRRLKYEDLEKGLLADYKLRGRRSLNAMPRVLAKLRLAFGGWSALAISPAAIRDYTTARVAAGAAAATINKELNALSRMRRLAVLDGRLPLQPPVPKLPTDNARRGFLDPPDFTAFCAELPEDLRPLARFAYLTGWRKSEVIGLTWRQIDLDAGAIRLENNETKTGQGRIYAFASDDTGDPMAVLLAELRQRRRLDCPYVFHRNGRPIRDFYAAWRAAAARVGRPGLHLHDFRRSVARNLDRAGVPTGTAMALMGHKTRSIFDRYNITSEADLRAATAKLSAYVAARSTETPRTVVLHAAGGESRSPSGAEPSKNRQSQAG